MKRRLRRSAESFITTASVLAFSSFLGWSLLPINAQAAQVTCSGYLSQVLTGANVDLIVNGKCSVPFGQNYVFHNINVISGGTLQFADPPNTSIDNSKTDLYAESIIVQNGGSLIAGTLRPFHPIGVSGGVVTIHLWGAQG